MVHLRLSKLREVVPGELVLFRASEKTEIKGILHLSGTVEATRIDAAALELVPLRVDEKGLWSPKTHYWGELGEKIENWAKPIIARGPRLEFEMEQVLPNADDEGESDPIIDASHRGQEGDKQGATQMLMDLCRIDLRCLDAHAHLGNLLFESMPADAMRHYEVGLRIGEMSLGKTFDGLLPWGWIDNRPFLRCMQGYGLCLWRLGRFQDASRIFERMLWLNPTDNQGSRFLLADVKAKRVWTDSD